jgi:hypothetical protein
MAAHRSDQLWLKTSTVQCVQNPLPSRINETRPKGKRAHGVQLWFRKFGTTFLTLNSLTHWAGPHYVRFNQFSIL